MASNTDPSSDVLQPHDHQKLSAEEIAKAVARHNKDHKGAPKNPSGQDSKTQQKKPGKH